jgi:decaprenyl-phosphate phosphoribosyltransferase
VNGLRPRPARRSAGVAGAAGAESIAAGEGGLPASSEGLIAGLVATARPRQWVKNLLVFAAPAAAGVVFRSSVLGRSVLAFAFFCVAASGVYFLNDAADADADRTHPRKRHRPVAAGVVGRPLAATLAAVLLAGVVAGGAVLLGRSFALCLALYAVINLAYSAWLKTEPVVDLAAVASGFLIRAIAGGVAVGVPLSDWFLIVAAFGSVFVVAGKREVAVPADSPLRARPAAVDVGSHGAEHAGDEASPAAPVSRQASYSETYLQFVRGVSATVAIAAYCLWAFSKAGTGHHELGFELSIVPFVLAMLRYALLVENGQGGAPEEVFFRDWRLLAMSVIWLGLFALGVYGA